MKKKIKDCTALEILANWENNKANENLMKVVRFLERIMRNLGKDCITGEYIHFDFNQVENDFDKNKSLMKNEILETEIEVEE